MSVSIGALAVSHDQQSNLMAAGWKRMDNNLKSKIQTTKSCCGFKDRTLPVNDTMGHPDCTEVSM